MKTRILAALLLVATVGTCQQAYAEGGFTMPTPIVETRNYGDKWCLEDFLLRSKAGLVEVTYQTFSGVACPAIGDNANPGWTGKHFRAVVDSTGTSYFYSDGTTERRATPTIDTNAVKSIVDFTKLITFASARAR